MVPMRRGQSWVPVVSEVRGCTRSALRSGRRGSGGQTAHRRLGLISTVKAPEIKNWKNPESRLEKFHKLRQNIPICWPFQKFANGSAGRHLRVFVRSLAS